MYDLSSRVKKNIGFSVVEVLVVVAILGGLSYILINVFVSSQSESVLQTESERVLSVLNDARSLTLSSKNDDQYGVHFEVDRYFLYKGATYVMGAPDNEEVQLSPRISISDVDLQGGGPDLLYERLTGKTLDYGSVTLELKSDSSKNKIITILQTGISSSN